MADRKVALVIGAGDATFQVKVTARMNELVDGAKALMLASHNDALLKRVCNRGLVMDQGSCVFQGAIGEALDYYHAHVRVQPNAADAQQKTDPAKAAAQS